MNKKIISLFVVAIAMMAAVAIPVNAQSLIGHLRTADAFHTPVAGDPTAPLYKEWHYFNILDEEQNLSFITAFVLQGDVSNPLMSGAVNLTSYQTTPNTTYNVPKFDVYPITDVAWSNTSPDLRIGGNSVTLNNKGYRVYDKSQDGQTVLDAVFKPINESRPVWNTPLDNLTLPVGEVMNWMLASSRMKVNGTLTVNKGTPQEKTYVLKNAKGYHDHNWGRWLWSDDMGWDWGQMSQDKNDSQSDEKYSISIYSLTNNAHTTSRAKVLDVWEGRNIISSFKDNEIEITHNGMANLPRFPDNAYPTVITTTATSGEDNLNIKFTTEQVAPVMIPLQPEGVNGFRIIWEITGKYEVTGTIDGEPVSFTTNGYSEYMGDLMMLP